MQNVGMNISDKRKLYREIARVLAPGGRYAVHEMAAGKVATTRYPLPSAADPSDNFLISAEEMRSLLGECGFIAELSEDTRQLRERFVRRRASERSSTVSTSWRHVQSTHGSVQMQM